ncbi:MAG TPA: UDP-glucuronic acid decarboxylase family protein [Myxococcales bacterium]|jgi:dTDP-glucose 4,6-dehydratase
MTTKRWVVTGGAGFLGSHLCETLLARGHEVVAVDNLITGNRANVAPLEKNPGFRYLHQDITEGLKVDGPVDYVLNFASPASPIDYAKLPIETLRVGSLGTENALKLAHANRARFIQASTSEIYGDPTLHPQPESYWGNVNTIGPRSCYDEAKRYGEAVVSAYRRALKVNTGMVRIFNTYGPRMRLDDGRVVPAFIGQALRGEDFTIFGDGKQTRSFCYVDDLVRGILLLAESDCPDPVNIGNPGEFTMLELAEVVRRLAGGGGKTTFHPFPQDDPKQRKPDITRAKKVLGWEPKIALEEGIRRTIEFFRGQVKA